MVDMSHDEGPCPWYLVPLGGDGPGRLLRGARTGRDAHHTVVVSHLTRHLGQHVFGKFCWWALQKRELCAIGSIPSEYADLTITSYHAF